jgi:hypothetical protein
MKKVLVIMLFLITSLPLLAVDAGQVLYLGGTIPALSANTLGKLDFTSETALQFDSPKGKFSIPYKDIDAFKPTDELTHHLGVLPAIAVGLTRTRKHRHYFRIVYHNESNVSQVVLFEVPKHMPPLLQAVLKARVERVCKSEPSNGKQLPGQRPAESGNCKPLAQFLAEGH